MTNLSKNVLITGGMGFIGKVLYKKLINETNYNLTIVDNLSSSNLDFEIIKNKRVDFIKKNFEDWSPGKKKNFIKYITLLAQWVLWVFLDIKVK